MGNIFRKQIILHDFRLSLVIFSYHIVAVDEMCRTGVVPGSFYVLVNNKGTDSFDE